MGKQAVSVLLTSAILLSTLVVGGGSVRAQGEISVIRDDLGGINSINGDLGRLTGSTPEERAIQGLISVKDKLGIQDVRSEFRFVSLEEGIGGRTHTRLDRVLNGLLVYGQQVIVHENQGRLEGITGSYTALTSTAIKPVLTADEAIDVAREHTGYYGSTSKPPEAKLVYYPQGDKAILSYQTSVVYLTGRQTGDWTIFVDAVTGNIIDAYNQAESLGGQGIGTAGDTKKINTVKKGTSYFLEDRTKPMYVNGSTIRTFSYNNGSISQTLLTDSNNLWDDASQRAAVDAHYYAGTVYDFYKKVLGWDSFDNKGSSIISGVHYSTNYNNAFWSSSLGQMVYGDGDGAEFSSLSGALDVVAHELTHAVTQYTSGLLYKDQSGALNESWSDAMAMAVENTDWMVGEDVYTPQTPGDALRYMDNPHRGGQPDKMAEYIVTTSDSGGVHYNSGIPNKAFYLFATAIGSRVDAGKVWYQASLAYMVPDTDFAGARAATLLACRDIYGASSTQYAALADAWSQVGVN